MKIILVGIGKVGYTVAEQLSNENHDVTVVDVNEQALVEASTNLDVICMHGNGATRRMLLEAGVNDCDLLIALSGSDEINMLCCLLARKLGAKSTIARIRNPEYNEDLALINDSLGLAMAINPEREAAAEILNILRFPAANNVEVFAKGKIDLVSFTAESRCAICSRTVRDSFADISAKALACIVKRGEQVFIPTGDTVIRPGDTVGVLVLREDTADFFKQIHLPVGGVKKTMIIGGGRIARYLAGDMNRLNMKVTIIERDEDIAEALSFALPGATVICGDGTSRTLLLEEGIEDMDALCCLTGFDEENILLSLFGKTIVPEIKSITKVNKTAFQEVVGMLDIGSVIYPQNITTNFVLRHVRSLKKRLGNNLEAMYKIIDNKVEALEFTVGEHCRIAGVTLENLRLRENTLIGCISRGGKFFIPHGQDSLLPGDTVIVVTTESGLDDLDDIKA